MDAAILKDPYANPKRAKAILFGVLLMHFGIIAVPFIYASLTEFFDPPVIVMKVGLADLPLGDSPEAGAPADGNSLRQPHGPVWIWRSSRTGIAPGHSG